MNKLLTVWGESLDRAHPLPEYPRPQLVRDSYVNLNGVWQYAITASDDRPATFDGEIVVPFSPESLLSGVSRSVGANDVLWYERTVALPDDFVRAHTLLHFGAVDQIADVYWNGAHLAHHEGGYLPFTVDITDALRRGENTLTLRVRDSLIHTPHAYGKQKYDRGGIWYTATSGIWQTVWMESVPDNYVSSLTLTPDFDRRCLRWHIHAADTENAHIVIRSGETCIAEEWADARGEGVCPIDDAHFHPWSPEDPFLYTVTIDLNGGDHVESYFAMRKFSTTTLNGRTVLALNDKPCFHNGLLDQGYWSDGLYTAPSDDALIYDIETAKSLGFNMLRKHIKVEPLRWYYHCDRLGMLVWQDMPSGGEAYNPLIISAPLVTGIHLHDSHYRWFGRGDPASRAQYESDLLATIAHLCNCPCIALWVPFNEGWGQFDALRITRLIREADPTRLVDSASGWHDQGGGDLKSYHIYFKPLRMRHDGRRALALTEFGGYSLPVEGHIHGKKFGYRMYKTAADYQRDYEKLYRSQVLPLLSSQSLSAAVYTELSDVEDELNGLLTFDRRVCKVDADAMRRLNALLRF